MYGRAHVRIAHVVIGGDVAGGQLVALRLARAAREAGHTASFVSPSDGEFLEQVRREDFVATIVPIAGALDLGSTVGMVRALRAARVEIVHTHGHFAVNTVARVAGRLAGAQVLSHMHIENAFRPGFGRRVQTRLDDATARLCFAIVAVSEATRTALLRQGYPAARLTTVHNGIEPFERSEPVRLADGPTIVQVARLADVKGQRTLIAALRRVDATAVFVGRDLETGGAYEQRLRDEARQQGVAERVVFAGFRHDVPGVLAGSDVFCLPSQMEGLPLVVLEAMSQARPVVATAVGGTPELVVHGETGLLFPPGDADALADALRELLGDPARARRMGEAGRARVLADFSAEVSVDRVLRLYRDAA